MTQRAPTKHSSFFCETQISMKSFIAVIVACALSNVAAIPKFVALIPNGDNVAGVAAVGHVNVAGGGPVNKFGEAFDDAGRKWTKDLCQADSDGDGQTNGQELGDPCCVWKSGSAPQLSTASAPGDSTSKSDPTTWANVNCDGTPKSSATTNVSPEAVKSVAVTPTPGAVTPKPTTSSATTTTIATATIVFGGLAVLF